MSVPCSHCGQPFTPKPGPGRPRKRCYKCRPEAPRAQRTGPEIVPEGLVARIRADLTSVGRLDTPKGLLAVWLAEQVAAGGHTASGSAALARQLDATLDGALAGTTVRADPVVGMKDELAARRSG